MSRSRITTTIVRLLCGALVILGGSTAVNSGDNGEPVYRVLAARQSTPLDWEDEDSIGLIIMPRYQPSENVYISGMETPDTILNILEQNRPDLSEEARGELAQLLEASLIESNLFSSTDALTHVNRKEGPSMPYVFFSANDGIPIRGEFAKSGPEGEVFVLGTFRIRVKGLGESLPRHIPPGELYIVEPDFPNYDYTFQVAIGLFR